MHSASSTHGLCTQCISKGGLNLFQTKKPNHCTNCQKNPDILFNQDPYCASCYIQMISSPTKSERASQQGRDIKLKSFYIPIDKQEVKNMKKSFLGSTGKLIKKISKIFEQSERQSELITFLNKKGLLLGNLEWEKFVPKVNKTGNLAYVFVGKNKIIGAFHSQSVNIEGQASVFDQQAGIFSTDRQKFQLQFARVKSDIVTYSCKTKTIKFGTPSSFEINIDKNIKVVSQMVADFEWLHCFLYRF